MKKLITLLLFCLPFLTQAQVQKFKLKQIQNIGTQTILGRNTTGTGSIEVLTPTQARSILNVANGAEANVQSDWTASSGDAFILNKPTIPAQVNLIEGNGIDITGTYPNLTISSTGAIPTLSQVLGNDNNDEGFGITYSGSNGAIHVESDASISANRTQIFQDIDGEIEALPSGTPTVSVVSSTGSASVTLESGSTNKFGSITITNGTTSQLIKVRLTYSGSYPSTSYAVISAVNESANANVGNSIEVNTTGNKNYFEFSVVLGNMTNRQINYIVNGH